MSFPDYLKGRLAEDYKNLITQKLQEVKQQSESIKEGFQPALSSMGQDLFVKLEREFSRIQEFLDNELGQSRENIQNQFSRAVENYVSSLDQTDLTPNQQQIDMLISDILSNVPPPPIKVSDDLASLKDLIQKLDDAGTQAEILHIVLQHLSNWVTRGVLFVVKGDHAAGWAAFGLGQDWDSARVKQIKVNLDQDHVIRHAVNDGTPAYGSADQYNDNSQIFFLLGGEFPKSALAFPILVRGKIAGILYADLADDLSEHPDLANLLFLATHSAGMAIDLLPIKPKSAPKPARAPQPSHVAASAAPPEVSTDPEPSPSLSAPTLPLSSLPYEEQEHDGSTVMMPPPVLTIVPPEDQKLHDDAKRFARLLVSEIKLYNEAQVSAGRENKDLYERLKDDIERSRRMYLERVPEHIHSTTNYFYEELVRTLANGDPSLLGM